MDLNSSNAVLIVAFEKIETIFSRSSFWNWIYLNFQKNLEYLKKISFITLSIPPILERFFNLFKSILSKTSVRFVNSFQKMKLIKMFFQAFLKVELLDKRVALKSLKKPLTSSDSNDEETNFLIVS